MRGKKLSENGKHRIQIQGLLHLGKIRRNKNVKQKICIQFSSEALN